MALYEQLPSHFTWLSTSLSTLSISSSSTDEFITLRLFLSYQQLIHVKDQVTTWVIYTRICELSSTAAQFYGVHDGRIFNRSSSDYSRSADVHVMLSYVVTLAYLFFFPTCGWRKFESVFITPASDDQKSKYDDKKNIWLSGETGLVGHSVVIPERLPPIKHHDFLFVSSGHVHPTNLSYINRLQENGGKFSFY